LIHQKNAHPTPEQFARRFDLRDQPAHRPKDNLHAAEHTEQQDRQPKISGKRAEYTR
jgi:hypothetical protein